MPASETPTCESCRWWWPSQNSHPDDYLRHCLRYPPHPKHGNPETYKNHSCGEHTPHTTAPSAGRTDDGSTDD